MHHIFAAVGADGVRIILFVGVGVTIHPIDINVTLVAQLKKDIFAADRFERLMNIDDQIPQIRGMILLSQHGVELVQVDGRTLPINEIRKEFLGFAVLKFDRSPFKKISKLPKHLIFSFSPTEKATG